MPSSAPTIALDDLDGRRLARAVGAEQRDDLAGRDVERDAVDDRPLAVALDQALDGDRRLAAVGGRTGHGAIRAYWRSKSASVSSPIWIDRTIPPRSMKYDCGRPTTR